MGGILVQRFINTNLWDLAKWNSTAFLFDPRKIEPPCLGIVFHNIAIGKQIFTEWRQYLGEVDRFEELRIAIIEGEITGKGLGYTVHISSEPSHTERRAEAEGKKLKTNRAIATGRVNRMNPEPNSPFLGFFKRAFQTHKKYFLIPASRNEAGQIEPHFDYGIEKSEVIFRQASEITESDVDSVIFTRNESDYWITIVDALSERLAQAKDKAKSISLNDIQSNYFDIIDKFVGQPYSEMKRHGLTPHAIAADMASSEKMVKGYLPAHEDYMVLIKEFWNTFAPMIREHLRKLSCLKSVYGGDISPSYVGNIVSSVGLYTDTVVLPDPLIKNLLFTGLVRPERLLYYTVKHALNILSYRELALADVEPPLLIIAPDYVELDESVLDYLRVLSDGDVLLHCSKLFGRNFKNIEELRSFLEQFSSLEQLITGIVEPDRLLFDSEWQGTPEQQFKRYVDNLYENYGLLPGRENIADILEFQVTGRMMQANELLFKSINYKGTPLIDAPTSWQYLLWKYQYDREKRNEVHSNNVDLLITKTLQVRGSREIKLLSELPTNVLLDLRRRGALSEFRKILRSGINEIDSASPSSLADITESVTNNINNALTKHELELDELATSKKRFFGMDVLPWLSFGTISIAAASTGNTLLSILAGSTGMIGASSAKDLLKQGKSLIEKQQELKRSPVAILFEHIRPKKYSVINRYERKKS